MSNELASTTHDIQELQAELRSAQAQRRDDLVVLGAQLDYAKRELAELEAAAELDGTDNGSAIADKEATIAQIERSIRAKAVALARQEEEAQELRERHADAQLRELQAAEREILEAAPAADARLGEAAFALMQAIIVRETLARRLHVVHTLMNDLHERTGKGTRRSLGRYVAPRYDIDAIVGAALSWARNAGHEVDMETWTLTKSDGKGERR